MYISPVKMTKQYAFGAKYTNPNGRTVDVSQKAIKQAETMAYIRNTVDEAMGKCPAEILYNPDHDFLNSKKLYFTIDENGKCVISNKEIPAVQYKGEIIGTDYSFGRGEASEIYACGVKPGDRYSDENGSIRADGVGYKFAHVLSDGSVSIDYPEWAP